VEELFKDRVDELKKLRANIISFSPKTVSSRSNLYILIQQLLLRIFRSLILMMKKASRKSKPSWLREIFSMRKKRKRNGKKKS
jgi:hypothetical protein